MCSWFWAKWCNYFCCVMFNCWVIHSKKSQKLSLQLPKVVKKYLSNRTCYEKIICTILFSSRQWILHNVYYACICDALLVIPVSYCEVPTFTMLCLSLCVCVCLFVCLQGGLIAVLTVLSYHDKFTGLILSSPATYGEIGTITVSQIMVVRPNSNVQ